MITGTVVKSRLPIVDVNVLDLHRSFGDSARQEDVVKLLVLVIEHISVPFSQRQVCRYVGFGQEAI